MPPPQLLSLTLMMVLTEAQTLWQVLSQELYAQLQVTRRRRRILGRIPVCPPS